MRIRIRHRFTFSFDDPARNLTHILRLTPRSHEGQRVSNWRIDVDPDCLLRSGEDHFGNLIHRLTIPGRTSHLALTIQGEIATFDVAGLVRGSAERLPHELYLRETVLTASNPAIRTFATDVTAGETDRIAKLHLLMSALHHRLKARDDAADTSAPAVFAGSQGTAEGIAHTFLACARALDYPARSVTGYRLDEDGPSHRHAWAEAYVDRFGWIGFDAVHDICPQDCYIRMAIGLDALDAAAIRGTRLDGVDEAVRVTWMVRSESASFSQRQSSSP